MADFVVGAVHHVPTYCTALVIDTILAHCSSEDITDCHTMLLTLSQE